MQETIFNESNKASELLQKLARGTADADFARALEQCVNISKTTGKKSKLKLTIDVNPRTDAGCMELAVDISTSLPRLPQPITQMHVGAHGELLTQSEFIYGGGPDERAPAPLPNKSTYASGRMPVVGKTAAPAPVAPAPTPAPMAG